MVKFSKSHWTVTRQSSEVTRPSADCQSTLFRHCSKNGKIFKKSLKGHVTVVGNHATVGRLSNNLFRRFNQNGKMLKKVAERSRDSRRMVTRPSADCQTILCRRFSKNGKILKKSCWTVDSGWRSRDRRPTVKQPFLDVSIKMAKFGKKVAGRSGDRRLTVKLFYVDVSAKMAKFKKKVAERSTVVGGHAIVDRLSNNLFSTFQSKWQNLEKKSPDGHATVDGGYATIGWLSNNIISTLQQKWQNFKKSRWTVTQQSTEVTRPSADCQTTLFRRYSKNGKILKKVAERSRDSRRMVTRPSADCQTILCRRFSKNGKILKKVAERSTVVGGHAIVDRLSNNLFSTFQSKWQNFEKSRRTVRRQSTEVTRPSADC